MAEKKHTSTHYEKELRDIKESLIYLGALVEKAIELAVRGPCGEERRAGPQSNMR